MGVPEKDYAYLDSTTAVYRMSYKGQDYEIRVVDETEITIFRQEYPNELVVIPELNILRDLYEAFTALIAQDGLNEGGE